MGDTIEAVLAYISATNRAHEAFGNPPLKWLVFKVPEGKNAYRLGVRFSCCAEEERAEYERDGAEFVDVSHLQKTKGN